MASVLIFVLITLCSWFSFFMLTEKCCHLEVGKRNVQPVQFGCLSGSAIDLAIIATFNTIFCHLNNTKFS